jgi:hypothetical protein
MGKCPSGFNCFIYGLTLDVYVDLAVKLVELGLNNAGYCNFLLISGENALSYLVLVLFNEFSFLG